ncbi:MAG: hypothetical protein ACO3QP_08935 [Burkholderiaceae bacterium]
MWTNLLALIINVVLLALTLASRLALQGGSVEDAVSALPWTSFGTELGEILWAEQVSASALTAGWISLTGLWILVTCAVWVVSRTKKRVQPTFPKRPEPAFEAMAPAPEPATVMPQAAPQAAPQPALKPAASDDQTFEALSQKAGRVSPEAQIELERLQAALSQLQKT